MIHADLQCPPALRATPAGSPAAAIVVRVPVRFSLPGAPPDPPIDIGPPHECLGPSEGFHHDHRCAYRTRGWHRHRGHGRHRGGWHGRRHR